jgi:adenylate cyclase
VCSIQWNLAHLFAGRYDDASSWAERALGEAPLVPALAQAGRLDEAKQALQQAMALAPKFFDMHVRQRLPWMRPEDYEHMLEGLRKAGWEG